MTSGISQLSVGGKTLASGVTTLSNGLKTYTDGVATLAGNNKALTSGTQQLADGAKTLADGAEQLASGTQTLHAGTQKLVSNNSKLNSGADQLADGAGQIQDGSSKLYDGSKELGDGITKLEDGSDTLATSLNDGAKEVKETNASDDTISMFATPITDEETKITTVENNGHAMAPYMMSVGLWVGMPGILPDVSSDRVQRKTEIRICMVGKQSFCIISGSSSPGCASDSSSACI